MLDAARAVFAEKGYEQATLDEIAERAEFGKGTLYNYFEVGKQEILYAVMEDLFERLAEVLHAFFRAPEQQQRAVRAVMRDFVLTMLTFFLDRLDLFSILMKEAHRMAFSPEHVTHMTELRERVVDQIVPALDAAIAAGSLRPLHTRGIAYSLIGHIQGHLNYLLTVCCYGAAPESDQLPTAEEAADFIATVLFDGLVTQPDHPFTLPQ